MADHEIFKIRKHRTKESITIGNTTVSVAYYSFYDNIQLYEMKVTAMEYNLWNYQ